MFDGSDYAWIKVINDTLVDTVESMSAMGNQSKNLILYATRSGPLSTSFYIPLIFTISKSDGTIVRVVEINDPTNIG